jgi:hypothetical protein
MIRTSIESTIQYVLNSSIPNSTGYVLSGNKSISGGIHKGDLPGLLHREEIIVSGSVESRTKSVLSAILRFAAAAIGSVIAFLAALLPERIKEREPFSGFQSNAAHVLSGISESILALVLFIYGYNHFVGGFSLETSSVIAERPDSILVSEAQMRGMGVLGFVLYLLHPAASPQR